MYIYIQCTKMKCTILGVEVFTLQNQISNCSLDSTANRTLSLLQITWTRVPAVCTEAKTFGQPTGKYIVIALRRKRLFDQLAINFRHPFSIVISGT